MHFNIFTGGVVGRPSLLICVIKQPHQYPPRLQYSRNIQYVIPSLLRRDGAKKRLLEHQIINTLVGLIKTEKILM